MKAKPTLREYLDYHQARRQIIQQFERKSRHSSRGKSSKSGDGSQNQSDSQFSKKLNEIRSNVTLYINDQTAAEKVITKLEELSKIYKKDILDQLIPEEEFPDLEKGQSNLIRRSNPELNFLQLPQASSPVGHSRDPHYSKKNEARQTKGNFKIDG